MTLNPLGYLRSADEHSLKLIASLSKPEIDHYQMAYSSQWVPTSLEAAVFTLELTTRLPYLTKLRLERKLKTVRSEGKRIALRDMKYIPAYIEGLPEAPGILREMQEHATIMRERTLDITQELHSQTHRAHRS